MLPHITSTSHARHVLVLCILIYHITITYMGSGQQITCILKIIVSVALIRACTCLVRVRCSGTFIQLQIGLYSWSIFKCFSWQVYSTHSLPDFKGFDNIFFAWINLSSLSFSLFIIWNFSHLMFELIWHFLVFLVINYLECHSSVHHISSLYFSLCFYSLTIITD